VSAAPGWYPDPRGHTGMQAWWDGAQWHLQARKPTEVAEIVGWIIGIALGLALSAIFPPALVLVGIIAVAWYISDQNKKKRLRAQWEWDHPAEHEWAKFSPDEKKRFIDDLGLHRKQQGPPQ
jgi:Protein of unknown function (DUF2510)